jgi:hypothetical protein
MSSLADFSYDEIYGVTLEEYTKIHNTTIDELINKTKIDIKILYNNLGDLMEQDLPYPSDFIIEKVLQTIKKKENHVSRLQEWKMQNFKK